MCVWSMDTSFDLSLLAVSGSFDGKLHLWDVKGAKSTSRRPACRPWDVALRLARSTGLGPSGGSQGAAPGECQLWWALVAVEPQRGLPQRLRSARGRRANRSSSFRVIKAVLKGASSCTEVNSSRIP